MNLSEQIKAQRLKRAEHAEAAKALLAKAGDENRDLTEEEDASVAAELDAIEQLDKQIERNLRAESLLSQTATPVPSNDQLRQQDDNAAHLDVDPNAQFRQLPAKQPYKAAIFTRMAIGMAAAKHTGMSLEDVCKSRWPHNPEVFAYIKAAVAPHDTTDTGGTSSLVQMLEAAGEFVDMLRPMTIVGRIPGMRRLEFDNFGSIKIPRQTGGVAGGYVGEDNSIRVQRLTFGDMTLTPSKMAVIVVASNESLRRSNPSLEQLIRDDMLQGSAETMDTTFLSEVAAADNPAGILQGVAATAAAAIAAGANVTAVTDAVRALIMVLRTNNVRFISPVFIGNPRTFEYLRFQRTTQETFAWRDEINAGTFMGYPFVTSTNVNDDVSGGPNDAYLVFCDANELFFAEDMAPIIDASEHATVQMDDAPATPPDLSGTAHVSLWQQDKTGFRLRMSHSWARRRDEAIAYGLASI